jgi:hypothetical protein
LLASEQNMRRHSSSRIIEKIKEQYEDQLNTLKIMIEHEIKEAITVIEDMCEVFKHQISLTEERVAKV